MTDLPADFQKNIDSINQMSREEIGRLMRFAPIGHDYMNGTLPYWKYLNARFQELGGWDAALSKHIGW